MKLNGKNGWALLLIALGALILLNNVGLSLGWLFGLIFPIALIFLGYLGIKNGKSMLGWILIIIGGLMTLGKFAGLLGIAIAAVLIVYGLSLLTNRKKSY